MLQTNSTVIMDSENHKMITASHRAQSKPLMISDFNVVTEDGYTTRYVEDCSIESLDCTTPMFIETHSDDLMLRSWNTLRSLANHKDSLHVTWVNLCEDIYGIPKGININTWKPTYKDVHLYNYVENLEDIRRIESLLGFLKVTDSRAQWDERSIETIINTGHVETNNILYNHVSGVHAYDLPNESQRYDGNGKFLSYESNWKPVKPIGDIVEEYDPSVIITHSWIDNHPHHFMSLLKILNTAGKFNIPVVMLSPLYANDTRSKDYKYVRITEDDMYAHLGAFTTTYLSQVMRNPYVYESTIQKTVKAHSEVGLHETYAVYEVIKCQ